MTAKLQTKDNTQSFYDRIADVHNLAMKINGYRDSLSKYLRIRKLDINSDSLVLDAGSGTGLVSLSLYSAGYRPRKTFALDLSYKSLEVAKEQFEDDEISELKNVDAIQGNLLSMPFADETFDFVITCGALEYVPLAEGIGELARVLKKNALLILIPIHPSLVGSILEVFYNFKTHSAEQVAEISKRYFEIVGRHSFPALEPISWSKKIYLLRKK